MNETCQVCILIRYIEIRYLVPSQLSVLTVLASGVQCGVWLRRPRSAKESTLVGFLAVHEQPVDMGALVGSEQVGKGVACIPCCHRLSFVGIPYAE